MAKTFKQFCLNTDVKKAEHQIKAADDKNQEKKASRYFKDEEDDVAIVEVEDIPLDNETYRKYLIN